MLNAQSLRRAIAGDRAHDIITYISEHVAQSRSLRVVGWTEFDVTVSIPDDIWDDKAIPYVVDVLTKDGYRVSVQSNDISACLGDTPVHTISLRF